MKPPAPARPAPVLGDPPGGDVAARSWPAREAAERALRDADDRLAAAPDDPEALFGRAGPLDRLGRRQEARQACLDVLARDMGHAGALLQLAAMLVDDGFTTAARTVLAQAIAMRPEDAAPRIMLGHLLRTDGEAEAARLQYEAALRSDPAAREAHQGLSYLLDGVDDAAAGRHRVAGFAGRALTTRPHRGPTPPVAVLRLVSARGGNVPTRHLLEDRTFLVHTLVVDQAEDGLALPAHALVFNAIGDADRCADALRRAGGLLEGSAVPVVNPPARVLGTRRADNAARLGRLAGVVAPRIRTVSRASLLREAAGGLGFPCLLRSPGYHTGENFLRVETAAGLADAVASLPGETLMAIEPLDGRGPDGAWRKYRVMMVGDALLPLHLAISPHWKVHHFTADMADNPAARAEEAAFLADMPGVLGAAAMAALGRIRDALRLDYGGIDFGIGPGGDVLLFEANATMSVAPPVPGSIWAYREPAVRAVLAGAQAMLLRRCDRP